MKALRGQNELRNTSGRPDEVRAPPYGDTPRMIMELNQELASALTHDSAVALAPASASVRSELDDISWMLRGERTHVRRAHPERRRDQPNHHRDEKEQDEREKQLQKPKIQHQIPLSGLRGLNTVIELI